MKSDTVAVPWNVRSAAIVELFIIQEGVLKAFTTSVVLPSFRMIRSLVSLVMSVCVSGCSNSLLSADQMYWRFIKELTLRKILGL
jgi:hypothetical protein